MLSATVFPFDATKRRKDSVRSDSACTGSDRADTPYSLFPVSWLLTPSRLWRACPSGSPADRSGRVLLKNMMNNCAVQADPVCLETDPEMVGVEETRPQSVVATVNAFLAVGPFGGIYKLPMRPRLRRTGKRAAQRDQRAAQVVPIPARSFLGTKTSRLSLPSPLIVGPFQILLKSFCKDTVPL